MEIKVSYVLDITRMLINELNLIISGTGTGKSYYIANKLIQDLKEKLGIEVEPYEILFVTSRRMTADQQVKQYKHLDKFCYDNILELDYMTIEKTITKIPLMTYTQFAKAMDERDMDRKRIIDNAKVIVFDEIHSIVSDTFADDMKLVKTYLKGKLNDDNNNSTYIIGMTATDDLINEDNLDVEVNYMLDKAIYNYKVGNIWTTTPVGVFPILQLLQGNSIVMTSTVKEAKELQSKIGSCAKVIVSRYNKEEFTEDMKKLIEDINENKALPQDVKVLITTSCMREGISLEPNDNFKIDNVVVYGGTIVNVMQFVGRYRGNIENLCIVDTGFGKGGLCEQQQEQLDLFKDYMYHGDGFDTYAKYLLPICKDAKTVYHKRFGVDDKLALFIDYIVGNWLGRLIWTKEQKDEIVENANNLGLRKYNTKKKKYDGKHTFQSIIRILELKGFDFDYEGSKLKLSNQFKSQYQDIDFKDKKEIRPYQLSDNENNRSKKGEGIS